MTDCTIEKVLPDGQAVVSTAGLYRVTDTTTGAIVAELVTAEYAKGLLDSDAKCYRDGIPRLSAVAYAEIRRDQRKRNQ